MQAMNFNDADAATVALADLKRKWVKITRQFSEWTEYWSEVAHQKLSHIVVIDPTDEVGPRFTATTLGKDFTVEMTSRIINGELYGRVLIHTPDPLNNSRLLAGEFLMSDNGKILSPEGAEIYDRNANNTADYILFCEIIRVAIAA
ncbi:MAG: hypothetical protein A3J24_08180 [Deltaproteobacteria bacterium RIFCSPLOWO2_02_FULL_53_8]|nr:MAG: hypothetical protein A3J24_08180 [Deltaproteobacteria bacterium RIFCSPLOWO2_02_FULL_53_8]